VLALLLLAGSAAWLAGRGRRAPAPAPPGPVAEKPPEPRQPEPLPPTFTNGLGMEFVLVPKGRLRMGGGGGTVGAKEAAIGPDYYLGKYEVTQGEWEAVTGLNPSHFRRGGGGRNQVADVPNEGLKRFPAEQVSWDDCQLFLAELNKRARESGWVYRLPTEAEWEYACRGGAAPNPFDHAFDFYFDKPTNTLLAAQANFAPEAGQGLGRTCQVGSYRPNRLGLFDMHGNVLEWCDDAVTVAGETRRVHRGGCWFLDAGYCRAAQGFAHVPTVRYPYLGLRLARVPVGKEGK
jgi:formylglycine-generating enzyme required for sulfatase activity